MRFILNSAVIKTPGRYDYFLITADEAAAWIRRKEFTSRVGYSNTADHIEKISGVRPAVNRDDTIMQPGDEALVVRLKYRLQDPGKKYLTRPGKDDWEYGILRKES